MKLAHNLIIIFLFGCASDVSIIKRYDETPSDTSITTAVDETATEPGDSQEPVDEPSSEMSDLTIGYGEIHFRQIACPACVGASGEFDITAELKLHYPTSGDYTDYLQPVGTCTTNLIETYVSSQPLQTS